MIPLNTFTSLPKLSDFLPPNDGPYYPLFQIVRGGINLGDNSQGRDVQDWVVYYEQNSIHVKHPTADVVLSLPVTDATSVSLAFDTAMRVVLTWTTLTDAYLYYYDTLTNTYITISYPSVTSTRVTVDKLDDFFTAESDVLFVYTKNNTLYYRQQRDRYGVEYTVGPADGYIKKVGLTKLNRFQIDISEIPHSQTNINVLTGIYVPVTFSGGIAQIKKCIITPSTLTVNEGGSVTYSLVTEWIPDGTILEYKKTSGSAVATDFSTSLTGTTAVLNNLASFILTVNTDLLIEGIENFIMGVNISGSVNLLAESSIVTIVDTTPVPTSTPTSTPAPGTPTYQLRSNVVTMNEGQSVIYTLTTTNVPNGTIVYWGSDYGLSPHNNTVTGSDFGYPNNLSISATAVVTAITVNNNSATFTLTATNDLTTEGPETLAITIRSSVPDGPLLARAALVTVIDSSIGVTSTPTATNTPIKLYNLISNTTNITEGGSSVTFTLNTTNVPNGTRLNYSTFENSVGLGWDDLNWSSVTSSGTVGDRQLANVLIYNNSATFTVWALPDSLIENTESFKVQITPYGGGPQLALSDTIYVTNVNSVNEPNVGGIGFNTSWLAKTGIASRVQMVVSIVGTDTYKGSKFKIRIIPTNSIFKVSHLEWSAFNNVDFNTFSPMQSVNDYVYQGSSSGPGVRLTAEGLALQAPGDGTFRIEILNFNTSAVLASSNYSVKYF